MARKGPRLVTRYRDKLDLPLAEFRWDEHTWRCIQRGRLRTVRDVVTRTEAQLLGIKGVGGATLQNFREFAESVGYVLEKGRASSSGRPELVAVNLPPAEGVEINTVAWRFVKHQLRRDDGRRVRFPNRSEVMRAGLSALAGMPAADLERVFAEVPELKRGRLSDAEADMRAKVARRKSDRRFALIDYVLSKFDFEGLAAMLARLDWKWEMPTIGNKTVRRVPTAADLERVAEELLERATGGEDEVAHQGLYVNNIDGGLRLMFVIGFQDAGEVAPEVKEQLVPPAAAPHKRRRAS